MKTGTKSVIFGVHQFLWHPITVWLAWNKLYGAPSIKETVCIFIHDWGYVGCSNMDDEEGERHPEFGAKLAGRLFGTEYYDLCLLHSRHYSRAINREPSKLCWADKLSIKYEHHKFYLLRAKLSGELREYRKTSSDSGKILASCSDSEWFEWVSNWLAAQAKEQKCNDYVNEIREHRGVS